MAVIVLAFKRANEEWRRLVLGGVDGVYSRGWMEMLIVWGDVVSQST
jgi:hypothetical protein